MMPVKILFPSFIVCLVLLGGKRSQELCLFISSLESSMSKFGTGINELKINSLKMLPTGVIHHTLSHDQRSLLDTNNGTLQHNPILINLTIVWESTHWCDTLLSKISSG